MSRYPDGEQLPGTAHPPLDRSPDNQTSSFSDANSYPYLNPQSSTTNDRLYASSVSSDPHEYHDPYAGTTEIPLQPTSYGTSSSREQRPAYTQPIASPASPAQLEAVDRPTAAASPDSDSDTASETDDEFDWDRDDEEGEEGKEDNIVRGKVRAKRGRRIWLWLKGLSVWARTFIIAAFGSTILIIPFIVVITSYKDNPARIQVQTWSIFLSISWAIGSAVTVLVDLVPQVFIVIILSIAGKVPEWIKSYVELLITVSVWIKVFLVAVEAWIVLSVCRAAIRPPLHYWVYINRVFQAFFACSLVLLAEKILLQMIAIDFHKASLSERLEANQSALRALDKLSNAVNSNIFARATNLKHQNHKKGTSSGRHTPAASQSYAHSRTASPAPDVVIDFAAAGVTTPGGTDSHHRRSGSGSRDDGTGKEQKKGWKKKSASKVIAGVGEKIKEFALEGIFGKGPEIGSLASARQLARKLFSHLESDRTEGDRPDGERVIVVDDFVPYFRNAEDAAAAFAHFDSDGNGDITKKEMRAAVQRIYRERKALTASLADMSSAISKLDGVLLGLVVIIWVFVIMLIFNRASTVQSLVPLSTLIVGVSFIFANSAKTLFESLIFIFSTHPYDVGDLVLIDTDYLFVKEFGLISTVFRRTDNQEIIAPNALLASSKLIHNIRRSRAMWEVCTLQISYETPLEVLEDLKVKIKGYLVTNSREWGGGMQLDIDSITKQNIMAINIAIEHRSNWADWGARWARRTAFMKQLKLFLEELEVTYQLPVQPILLTNPGEFDPLSGGAPHQFNSNSAFLGNAGGGPGLAASPYSMGGGRPTLAVNTHIR